MKSFFLRKTYSALAKETGKADKPRERQEKEKEKKQRGIEKRAMKTD